jgi:hypothetical protein
MTLFDLFRGYVFGSSYVDPSDYAHVGGITYGVALMYRVGKGLAFWTGFVPFVRLLLANRYYFQHRLSFSLMCSVELVTKAAMWYEQGMGMPGSTRMRIQPQLSLQIWPRNMSANQHVQAARRVVQWGWMG